MEQHGERRPLVSVIMPAYNAEKYIEQAIRSVCEQTVEDLELIILDDCSTDKTVEIAEREAASDLRISVICNESNVGVAKTRNRGLDLAKGTYVALLDSDDYWYPEKLEKQLQLAEESGADIVYCGYSIVDDEGNSICEDFCVPETTSLEDMLVKSVISCSTALFARSVVNHYRFETGYYHEDYLMWLNLLQHNMKAVGYGSSLAAYRIVNHSRASNKIRVAIHRWKIYRTYLGYSALQSLRITMQYALLGFKKYKRLQ